jgi:putative ATPase
VPKRKSENLTRNLTLFAARAEHRPLADRMRPQRLEDVLGQQHLLGPGRLLHEIAVAGTIHSLILWGPPGSGKTTLARLITRQSGAVFCAFSAVNSGMTELRETVEGARRELALTGRRTVLFIDEIHRWNRAQQDGVLPYVESGLITLIGATTENPSFHVAAPLLSRSRVLVLHPLGQSELVELVNRAMNDAERGLGGLKLGISPAACDELVQGAAGDARKLLSALELAAEMAQRAGTGVIEVSHVREASQHKALIYDRAGEEHYNVISAFIKSMRGSDPDAALFWLMRMIEAGEDPLFVARRMVIFAAEDIGNADPEALKLAIAVKDAVDFLGLPEAEIPLAQGVTYLATAPKSDASYRAMGQAREDVERFRSVPVPMHLRNAPTGLMKSLGYGRDYRYPHDYPDAVAPQELMPEPLRGRRYYFPSKRGYERRIGLLMERARLARAAHSKEPLKPPPDKDAS